MSPLPTARGLARGEGFWEGWQQASCQDIGNLGVFFWVAHTPHSRALPSLAEHAVSMPTRARSRACPNSFCLLCAHVHLPARALWPLCHWPEPLHSLLAETALPTHNLPPANARDAFSVFSRQRFPAMLLKHWHQAAERPLWHSAARPHEPLAGDSTWPPSAPTAHHHTTPSQQHTNSHKPAILLLQKNTGQSVRY